jgi:hypothetical protein
MSLDEHEEFLRVLTEGEFQTEQVHDYKERIKHVSGSLVKRSNTNFTDVVSAMKAATKRDVAWSDNGKTKVTFDQMLEKVANAQNLYTVDERVKQILEDFNEQMVQRLMKLLGQTALDISHAYGIKTGRVKPREADYSQTTPNYAPNIDYRKEAKIVSELEGCMSRGVASWQNTALGARIVLTEKEFECPRCHGKIESGKGITTCPHCNLTKEQAAKLIPESKCD